ncbi:MAG: hypothetical protein JO168_15030 [Solirubrobacterales bacterium]|nr:hypothetical protein [Solirubrobacterales bacterium]MBV9717248.1 hypothetical protein [Solirubrobacterales bacterium]
MIPSTAPVPVVFGASGGPASIGMPSKPIWLELLAGLLGDAGAPDSPVLTVLELASLDALLLLDALPPHPVTSAQATRAVNIGDRRGIIIGTVATAARQRSGGQMSGSSRAYGDRFASTRRIA